MGPRRITADYKIIVCAVCGRTLLQGEEAVVFRAGSERRDVCALCTNRARKEGWIRESGEGGGGGVRVPDAPEAAA